MAAVAIAAIAAGTLVVTRDIDDVVEDTTEVTPVPIVERTDAYSFAAAATSAQEAQSVVFDMQIDGPDGPMSATASFDRASGRLAMDLDLSQVSAGDDVFEIGDSLSFIVDDQRQVAYVSADFFAMIFGPTDREWISMSNSQFAIDDDVFGDVFTNPLDIADVFGDVEPLDLGDETLDGEVLRHFAITLDDAAIAGLGDDSIVTPDTAQTDGAVTFDVWVDESSQIRRILFEAVDQGEVGSVDMWVTISSDPLDIALPEPDEFVDIDEMFSGAFDDLEIEEN